jgi:hypothetical protein
LKNTYFSNKAFFIKTKVTNLQSFSKHQLTQRR